MSYEGYTIVLCEKGHRSSYDAYEAWRGASGVWACPHCGAGEQHVFDVDCTNGPGKEPKLMCVEPPVVKQCNLGHSHIVEPARWAAPRRKR
jgi:hypothetical protein